MITIKTQEDIAKLREGGRRLEAILHELEACVCVGNTPRTLEEKARTRIAEGGDIPTFFHYTPAGASFPYPAVTCISVNDAVVHGIPTDIPFKEGDVVSIDLGLTHQGLVVDASRCVCVKAPQGRVQELIATTQKALDAGIAVARSGAHVGDIGFAVQTVVAQSNFSLFVELGGHGVGYSLHEEPFISNVGKRGTGSVLKPGMVLAIEVMLADGQAELRLDSDGYTYRTCDGSLTTQIEDTVLVTRGGPEILTRVFE